jgi:hypothetical protein
MNRYYPFCEAELDATGTKLIPLRPQTRKLCLTMNQYREFTGRHDLYACTAWGWFIHDLWNKIRGRVDPEDLAQ